MPFKATGDAMPRPLLENRLRLRPVQRPCATSPCKTPGNSGLTGATIGTDLGIDGVDAAETDTDQDLARAGRRGVDFSALK